MKTLIELAKIVSSYHLDNIAVFNVYNRNENTNYNRFLEGLIKDEFHSDGDAAKAIYNKAPGVEYRVLKNRLKLRLYNNILFMDSGKRAGSGDVGVYYSTYRHMVVAKFLFALSAKKAASELMKKILVKAIKHQMHDIVQQCALHFRRESMLMGDKKAFDQYNQLFKEANTNMLAEAKAEELYYTVMIHFNKSSSKPRELIDLAKKCSESIKLLAQNHDTFLVRYYEHNISTIYYQLVNDFRSALESCNDFEKYLSGSVFYTKVWHGNIMVTKLSCYLHLSEFEEGIKQASVAIDLYAEGTVNWFIVLEIYFLLSLNHNDLQKATDLYCLAVEHNRFNYLRPQQIEVWKIFGGYLWLLLKYHNEESCIKQLTEHRLSFRISKLINEIPLFAQDKKGMNVAVLILQVLLLLEKRDFVEIMSRTEALESYIYRNLTKDDAHRSNIFIKMLIAMEKVQFDRRQTELKTKGLLEKMKQGELSYTATQARMEIIPYERLWEMTLNLASRN